MRIKSIDFLRGIAIILVLFRHNYLTSFTTLIGWSGVDLFFILSGFLVSGLLFHEYQKEKTIQPMRFLIRRGFKIYPLFWCILAYVVITHYFTGFGTDNFELLSELFFFQNYIDNKILFVTWSLAVEEHFYILLIIAVSLAVKFKKLENKKGFHIFTFIVLLYCLAARIITSIQYPEYSLIRHYSPTHLRIDALTFGVVLSYNYYFNKIWLTQFVHKYKKQILTFAIISLTPILIWDTHTIFIRTIGFTFIYLGFGSTLALFLLVPGFNAKIEKYATPFLYKYISKIGVYSYAIYLTHVQVVVLIKRITVRMYSIPLSDTAMFVLYFVLSIAVGVLLTNVVEKPFLTLREKLFPANKARKAPLKIPQVQTA